MNGVSTILLSRLAATVDHALPSATLAEAGVRSASDRARDRLLRAKKASETLDSLERYGVLIAVLAGGAAAYTRK